MKSMPYSSVLAILSKLVRLIVLFPDSSGAMDIFCAVRTVVQTEQPNYLAAGQTPLGTLKDTYTQTLKGELNNMKGELKEKLPRRQTSIEADQDIRHDHYPLASSGMLKIRFQKSTTNDIQKVDCFKRTGNQGQLCITQQQNKAPAHDVYCFPDFRYF
eukprot:1145569-Pelagomonas_calceolata.AAC.3